MGVLTTLLELIGAICLVVAAAMVTPALGVAVAGVAFVVFAIAIDLTRGDA